MRPALHAAAGLLALALRFVDAMGAAALAAALVVHNRFLLPRYMPSVMRPPGSRADLGVRTYPWVVLGAVLLFRSDLSRAAAVWALLAFGDAAAAVLGRLAGGPCWPWNPDKRLLGSAGFAVVGAAAAAATARFVAGADGWGADVAAPGWIAAAAVAGALAESARSPLDDNVRIGLAAAAVLAGSAIVDPARVPAATDGLLAALPLAVALAGGAAVAGVAAGALDRPGALLGAGLGVLVAAGGGVPAFAVLATFVVLGSAATRLGRVSKEARGLAQAHGGRRGPAHALANGGVAAAFAILAPFSGSAELLRAAFAGAVATAAFDTVATEVGSLLGRNPRSWPGFRPVPPGTPGAVSLAGTLAGFVAAVVVAAVAVGSGLLSTPVAVGVPVAAAAGALAESWLAGSPRAARWLGPHARNVFNTVAGAAGAAALARTLA